jgi:hypothetical protein
MAFAFEVMLSVGEGLRRPAREERLRVFTFESIADRGL